MERMTRGLSSKLKVHGRPQHRAKGVTVGIGTSNTSRPSARSFFIAVKIPSRSGMGPLTFNQKGRRPSARAAISFVFSKGFQPSPCPGTACRPAGKFGGPA